MTQPMHCGLIKRKGLRGQPNDPDHAFHEGLSVYLNEDTKHWFN